MLPKGPYGIKMEGMYIFFRRSSMTTAVVEGGEWAVSISSVFFGVRCQRVSHPEWGWKLQQKGEKSCCWHSSLSMPSQPQDSISAPWVVPPITGHWQPWDLKATEQHWMLQCRAEAGPWNSPFTCRSSRALSRCHELPLLGTVMPHKSHDPAGHKSHSVFCFFLFSGSFPF